MKENIRYGRLDATEEEIVRAAKLTEAHEFIEALSGGYGAAVGEGGNQLSTGQKQLIALARAVIADPQIFVMDEATSSVDTQNGAGDSIGDQSNPAESHQLRDRSSPLNDQVGEPDSGY